MQSMLLGAFVQAVCIALLKLPPPNLASGSPVPGESLRYTVQYILQYERYEVLCYNGPFAQDIKPFGPLWRIARAPP